MYCKYFKCVGKKTLVKKKSNLLSSVVVCGSVIYNDGVESSGMECN